MAENNSGMEEKKRKEGKEKNKLWYRSEMMRCVLIFLAEGILLFGIFFSVFTPRKYDFRVGSISQETINATNNVIDEVATEEKRQAAANAIEPTYHFQAEVKDEVLTSLSNVFSELRTVQQYGLTLRDQSEPDTARRNFTDDEINYAIDIVSSIQLSRYQITTLLRIDTVAFDDMVNTVTIAVENALNATIREGFVSQSIQNILQIVGYKVDVSMTQTILPTVLRTCIKPNMTIDQEATDAAKTKVMEEIEPIVYLQGQNIIREGDIITLSQLEMLRSLGLLSDNNYDYTNYYGAFLCILVSLVCLFLSLYMLMKQLLTDLRRLIVIMLVILLGVALAAIIHLLPSMYLTPVTLAAILVTVLIHYRAGIAVTIPMAVLITGLSFGSSANTMVDSVLQLTMTLTGSLTAVWFLKGHPQRIRVLLAGPLSGLICSAMILTVRLLTGTTELGFATVGWVFAGSLLSGALATAFQPLFENLFRLPTPSKLLELTNPNQPLMRRLLIEASGTYHHSIIVANLAEAAAARIGANPYLARAGAYYHDIGKLKRPLFFKENQVGDNPHDKTDPYVSAAILTSHTKDGVLIAQKEKLPVEVQDIIRQHHGVTPVMYFYHKALQMSNGSQVDIDEFRYEGPRPQTREAAIVMLADTIEAAVRSMKDPTPKSIDQNIERLVRGRVEDGQLSDSPLTLHDIDEICAAFANILKGVFHERIEYPTVKHSIPMPGSAAPAAQNSAPVQAQAAPAVQNPAPVQAQTAPIPSNPSQTPTQSAASANKPTPAPAQTASAASKPTSVHAQTALEDTNSTPVKTQATPSAPNPTPMQTKATPASNPTPAKAVAEEPKPAKTAKEEKPAAPVPEGDHP